MDEPNIIEVTGVELAEYLGLSDRRVRQLHKEGVVHKTQRGTYDLKKSVLGYINQLRNTQTSNDETLEKLRIGSEAEKLSHEKLKKRKTELSVLQMERKLHAQEDVEFFWNTMAMAVKSRLLAIPVKLSPVLVGMEDRREVQSILKREIGDALNEIAEYDVEQYDTEFEESDDESE